jgi:hypothetical protein
MDCHDWDDEKESKSELGQNLDLDVTAIFIEDREPAYRSCPN